MVKVLTPVAPTDIPDKISAILSARTQAKSNRDFARADLLRRDAEQLGYVINDKAGGVQEVLKIGDRDNKPQKNFLILFGSGEIAPTSVDIYRSTFLQLGKRDLTISLITTPAGFQPNVVAVYEEIRDFLLASLPDFNLNIKLVPINTRADADNPQYLEQLKTSDVLFLGPGSPTYGIKQLKDTKVEQTILEQVKKGSTLILASAATITFSKYALPVYEIYKVGEELHWERGLNLYRDIWQEVSIIPHFNNREGGVGLDTSYCYIGKERAEKLILMLPKDTQVMGIDEHTALLVDLDLDETQVRGKGDVHVVQL
ncbi:MAG: hypothetical protein Fur0011_6650 [Candidatus Microgenomates bacterium]